MGSADIVSEWILRGGLVLCAVCGLGAEFYLSLQGKPVPSEIYGFATTALGAVAGAYIQYQTTRRMNDGKPSANP